MCRQLHYLYATQRIQQQPVPRMWIINVQLFRVMMSYYVRGEIRTTGD